jgi:hypothetical protein
MLSHKICTQVKYQGKARSLLLEDFYYYKCHLAPKFGFARFLDTDAGKCRECRSAATRSNRRSCRKPLLWYRNLVHYHMKLYTKIAPRSSSNRPNLAQLSQHLIPRLLADHENYYRPNERHAWDLLYVELECQWLLFRMFASFKFDDLLLPQGAQVTQTY